MDNESVPTSFNLFALNSSFISRLDRFVDAFFCSSHSCMRCCSFRFVRTLVNSGFSKTLIPLQQIEDNITPRSMCKMYNKAHFLSFSCITWCKLTYLRQKKQISYNFGHRFVYAVHSLVQTFFAHLDFKTAQAMTSTLAGATVHTKSNDF